MTHNFSTGDNVEVTEGELMNLLGKILAVDGSKITMQPKHDDLKDPLEFQASELKKYFRQGDHVKVNQLNPKKKIIRTGASLLLLISLKI